MVVVLRLVVLHVSPCLVCPASEFSSRSLPHMLCLVVVLERMLCRQVLWLCRRRRVSDSECILSWSFFLAVVLRALSDLGEWSFVQFPPRP